jgi:transposase
MTRIEIATLVRCYHQLEQETDSITQHLGKLIKTSVGHEWLSTVPGLGDTTIVDLLAEIGSLSHYEDPRQLLKLTGLT